jgi:sugar phosphate isomerase/epimerase
MLLVIFHIAPSLDGVYNGWRKFQWIGVLDGNEQGNFYMNVGTLLRCGDVTERRIAFFREAGLDCLQIAGVYEDWLAPTPEARKASDELFDLFKKYGMAVPSLFLSYTGQDWNNPEETVGLVPAATRSARMVATCRQMEWAARRGIRLISCHAGFLSGERDAFHARFVDDMKQLLRFAAACGQEFLFETGSETAEGLNQLLEDIGEPNAGINFDPANILIYGKGDPAQFAEKLGSRIKLVHCKDANPPAAEAVRGRETPLGKGSTNFATLLKRVLDSGFQGPLVIERELPPGPEQEKDVAEAVKFLNSIVKGH